MEKVDMIASGYEWICPNCGKLNYEIEWKSKVQCADCKKKFETDFPEHAFGE